MAVNFHRSGGVKNTLEEDDSPIMQNVTSIAGPVTFTYPQDVQMLLLHLNEDLCCLGGFRHGSDVTCPNADLDFRP